jgi:hypothetical protein
MLYQNEFQKIKEIYVELPDASRETAQIISSLPVAAMALFGLTLMPFGIIGLGTVLIIGILATPAALIMMGACIPCGEHTGLEGMKAWVAVITGHEEPSAALPPERFTGAPVQIAVAANDAEPVSQSKARSEAA